jgi:hypothetical protein
VWWTRRVDCLKGPSALEGFRGSACIAGQHARTGPSHVRANRAVILSVSIIMPLNPANLKSRFPTIFYPSSLASIVTSEQKEQTDSEESGNKK